MDTSGRIPWAVLGIAQDACLDDARRAFRRLAKSLHPDAGGDAAEFATVVEAFRAFAASAPRHRPPPAPTPYDWTVRPRSTPRVWAEVAPPRPPGGGPAGAGPAGFAAVLERELARLADAA